MAVSQKRTRSNRVALKVFCGEEAEIIPPFETRQVGLDWIDSNAWRRFQGEADRVEVFDVATNDRRTALEAVQTNGGCLLFSKDRPLTTEQGTAFALAAIRTPSTS